MINKRTWRHRRAFMRVFPYAMFFTTKTHFNAKYSFAEKKGLVVKTIAQGKTRKSAVYESSGTFHLLFVIKNHLLLDEWMMLQKVSLEGNIQ